MASLEQVYSSKIFNSAPDLNGSREAFLTKNGSQFVNGTFRNLVEKHSLESVFGIGLLHRHFDLNDDEKLVEFNNISTPWHHQEGDVHTGGKIIPNAWLINGGRLMPYEFYFSPLGRNKKIDLAAVNKFLTEFIENAVGAELDRIVALRAFPGVGYTGGLEVTEGCANINLKPDEIPTDAWNDTTETMWFFEPGFLKEKRICRCSAYSGHMHFHSPF